MQCEQQGEFRYVFASSHTTQGYCTFSPELFRICEGLYSQRAPERLNQRFFVCLGSSFRPGTEVYSGSSPGHDHPVGCTLPPSSTGSYQAVCKN
jgi:hypothetical protein